MLTIKTVLLTQEQRNRSMERRVYKQIHVCLHRNLVFNTKVTLQIMNT